MLAAALVPATGPRTLPLGRSVELQPIVAQELGDPRGPRVLVVGCIHGNECAGRAVVRELERRPPRRIDLWLVPNLNPDGYAAGTRTNADGVDLNHNFPALWKRVGSRGDPGYSGPRPLSEPETRIARALLLRLRPAVTIWFHQPQAIVRAWGHWPNGSATNWQNHRFPQASFVVELPSGPLTTAEARRYAAAVAHAAR